MWFREMQIYSVFALCRRIEYILPQLNDIEELHLHLPRVDCAVWLPLEAANLKSVSLSCQDCECQIEDLLYWPPLEHLHIANLDCFDLVSLSFEAALPACQELTEVRFVCLPFVHAGQTPGVVPVPLRTLTITRHSCQALRKH